MNRLYQCLALVGALAAAACLPQTRLAAFDRTGLQRQVSEPLRAVRLYRQGAVGLLGGKVIGGVEALPGQAPWQVALGDALIPEPERDAFCGGSIIGDLWVLTAAHCVDADTLASDVAVVHGTVNLDQAGERRRVTQIIVHPAYHKSTKDNDIALLRLDRPIGGAVPLTDVPLDASLTERTSVTVTGFGATYEDGPMTKQLRILSVPFVSRETCNLRVAYDGEVSENMICAGYELGGRDSCQGDSGGPLTAPRNGQAALVGVVSWGWGCAQANRYGVYTRVANYLDWIALCRVDAARCRERT